MSITLIHRGKLQHQLSLTDRDRDSDAEWMAFLRAVWSFRDMHGTNSPASSRNWSSCKNKIQRTMRFGLPAKRQRSSGINAPPTRWTMNSSPVFKRLVANRVKNATAVGLNGKVNAARLCQLRTAEYLAFAGMSHWPKWVHPLAHKSGNPARREPAREQGVFQVLGRKPGTVQ